MFASPMTAGSLALLASLAGAPPGEPAPAPDARQTKAALLGCLTRNFIELEDGSSSAEVLGRTIVARCRLEVAACATINSCDAARLAPEGGAGPSVADRRAPGEAAAGEELGRLAVEAARAQPEGVALHHQGAPGRPSPRGGTELGRDGRPKPGSRMPRRQATTARSCAASSSC